MRCPVVSQCLLPALRRHAGNPRRNPRAATLIPSDSNSQLTRLSGGLVEALNDAGVREKLKPVMEVETSTPEALRAMVERDIERYGNLVRHVGMKVE